MDMFEIRSAIKSIKTGITSFIDKVIIPFICMFKVIISTWLYIRDRRYTN